MLSPELEEKVCNARRALDGATSESIIELCKQYLSLLAEYRAELYKLPATLDLNPRSNASSSQADVQAIRKAVRAAIEQTIQERNTTEALLRSFIAVSGYGAVETLNRQKYKGWDDWQLSAGGVSKSHDAGCQKMTIQEAVETASLLRREEYVAQNAGAAGARRTFASAGYFQSEAEHRKEAHDDNL
jgi:hypothetical protein